MESRWCSARFVATLAFARLRRASGANISPGPYRSFRELSLAGSVDPDIWCPPTFVGNSGIERSNGDRGFALYLMLIVNRGASFSLRHTPRKRGIQYAAAVKFNDERLCNTGSPAFAGD